jgi:hypothetical protein
MKKMYVLWAAFSALFFTACTSDDSITSEKAGELVVSANIGVDEGNTSLRSMVDAFTSSHSLGVYVVGDSYTPTATEYTTTNGTTFVASSPIYINGSATVYSYFPYQALANPGVSSSIDVTGSVTDNFTVSGGTDYIAQTDYMYATTQLVGGTDDRLADLKFHHALAKLTFNVATHMHYAGNGYLTKIELSTAEVSTDNQFKYCGTGAKMAVAGGAFTTLSASGTLTFNSGTATSAVLGTTAKELYCLVAPASLGASASTNVTLKMTIDSKIYSTTLPLSAVNAWLAGYNYTYNVTVGSDSNILEISGVTIDPWSVGGTTDGVVVN